MQNYAQTLIALGKNNISKEEFIRSYNKNKSLIEDKDNSIEKYLSLFTDFKMKVNAALDLKLDTLEQIRFDLMNFRKRIEDAYMVDAKEAMKQTRYKRNPTVTDDQLSRYADSVTLIPDNHEYPIAKQNLFTIADKTVKVAEWLAFAKTTRLNYQLYKGETNMELLDQFISNKVLDYYRKNLEQYNVDFKYQLQDFVEGNLLMEIMGKKVWAKSAYDTEAQKKYYDTNKANFVWIQAVDVILVNAKSYAYADYAAESMKKGQHWNLIASKSEGMIQADSSRFEISELPIKQNNNLKEGSITEIVKNELDNGASFVKIIRLHPAKMQQSFAEAKASIINEIQQQLEKNWLAELLIKYPVKMNKALLATISK